MSINIWFSPEKNEYNVYYNGNRYVRVSYIAAKELIDQLLGNMVALETYGVRS